MNKITQDIKKNDSSKESIHRIRIEGSGIMEIEALTYEKAREIALERWNKEKEIIKQIKDK